MKECLDFRKKIAEELAEALHAISADESIETISADEIERVIEIPQEKAMGDYAFPCFRLAKVFHEPPDKIAARLAEATGPSDVAERVEAVRAYVNIFLRRDRMVEETIRTILTDPSSYGKTNQGNGRTVLVEFSSPNIAKPFHIGHIRSTVIGNSLYKIYEALGYRVVRINHLGDYGTQFGKMIVAYRHWGCEDEVKKDPIKTLLSYYTKFHVEAEKDPELEEEAREAFAKLEQGEKAERELWQWFRRESLTAFKRVYALMGIEFDSYKGESFYSDTMSRFEEELRTKGLMKESQGAEVVDLSSYGLDIALIKKSDGSSLYMTRDIAAACYRKDTYDFYKNIYVVASQQNLHFAQLFKILDLMGYIWAKTCVHVPFGMVRLEEGTMSTRHGRVVFLEDVLNKAIEKTKAIIREKNPDAGPVDVIARQVGVGAVMFNELANNRIKDYTFVWDQVLNFDGETGPYVQYTHARCASLLRKAGKESAEKAQEAKNLNTKYVQSDTAFDLVRLLYAYPAVVAEAGEKYEPSVITRHIIDIAQAFNKFYHDEHILVENEEEKTARLAVAAATKAVLKNGLALLGVQAPERM